MSEAIKFKATVCRLKTLADGGLRFEFDAPEDAIMQMAMLAECKRAGVVLEVECKIPEKLTEVDDETKQGAEKTIIRVGRRRASNR